VTVFRCALPWPPSVNSYWCYGVTYGGRVNMRLTTRGRDYKAKVRGALLAACADVALGGGFGDARLRVCLDLCAPDRRARDLDNHAKAILDALESAGVFEDDSQIDVLELRRGPIVRGGRVEVSIEAIS